MPFPLCLSDVTAGINHGFPLWFHSQDSEMIQLIPVYNQDHDIPNINETTNRKAKPSLFCSNLKCVCVFHNSKWVCHWQEHFFQWEFELAWIKPKLNLQMFSQSCEKDLFIIAGSYSDTNIWLFRSSGDSKRCQTPTEAAAPVRERKIRRWVMAVLHGMGFPQFVLMLFMAS